MRAKTYLLETYLSKTETGGPAGIADRAERSTEEMRRRGIRVRYLRSIFVPQDETCFHIFEASSEAAVRDAAARAGIRAARVLETTTFDACDSVSHADGALKEER